MAVDLGELLGAAAAERIGRQSDFAAERGNRQSDASTNFLAMQDRAFLKNILETDPVQAAAIKDIQRGPAPQPGLGS